MIKLMKFLRPFLFWLTIAILLLFVQAMSDLALPDYMSNIVNTGIQQGGVDTAIPEVLTQTDMDHLLLFWDEGSAEKVLNAYSLIGESDQDYAYFIDKYTLLERGSLIYVLQDISQAEVDEINLTVAKGMMALTGIEMMKENAVDGMITFNGRTFPADTDLFALMAQMPAAERQKIMDSTAARFELMGDSMVIQAGANAVKTYYTSLGMDTGQIQRDYILRTGAIMLLISLIAAACSVAVGFLSARIAAGLGKNLRKSIFDKVSNFSNVEFDRFSTASLITRSTNDVTQIQTLMVMMIRMVFYAPIMGVGGVIRAMSKSPSMSWIIALAVLVIMCLIVFVFIVAVPKFKIVQKLIDRLNTVTRENLNGMMVIRAFNTQKFEEKRFDKANQDLTKVNLFVNRIMVALFPAMMLIMNGVMLLIIWVGAHQIADANMMVGDMMAYMQYAMQIIFAFVMLSMMFIMIPRAAVSAQRISEVLETKLAIEDPLNPQQFNEEGKGVLEFRNVSFRYPGAEEDMLKNINFTAKAGKVTALIGSTGSGKTTLVNLIPRFYDVTAGEVLIDGVNVQAVTQHELRRNIGYVPQKTVLFSGTIASNINYGSEEATWDEMIESAEVAQATEFIDEKEERYDAEIAQAGSNVSGGQKQRLSIARALIKKPKIYIFDDSFSALDFKTDAALRRALRDRTAQSTILIVAQRISTIRNAEQIIVLEDGEIAGIGTHDDLMKNCSAYQEIAYSQLSKEELA